MAIYKVPQDVEADDKLLGPFSFRQFIYLIIVALACFFAWLLSKIFIGLIIIPLPIIVFFGALALPLKKDQPMEAYLAAIISFYFIKPRKRLWKPDGLESLVEITAPREVEPDRVKHLSQQEASTRLGYLTDIIDSRGWAVRGLGVHIQGTNSMQTELYEDATSAPDMFEGGGRSSQKFNQLLAQSSSEHLANINQNIQRAQQQSNTSPRSAITTPTEPTPAASTRPLPPVPTPQSTPRAPLSATPREESSSVNTPSPAIIELANHSEGLTVADVARQAARIRSAERKLPEEEVNISLH